jgi:hypothetical protein
MSLVGRLILAGVSHGSEQALVFTGAQVLSKHLRFKLRRSQSV